MASPFPPVPLPVDPILFAGPVLIGILLTYLLFGVLLAQVGMFDSESAAAPLLECLAKVTYVAQYYQTVAPSDKKWLQVLVAVVVIIQFLQLSFITDNAWTVCVLGFIDPMNLISPPVSAPGTGVLNGMVSLCVQMFFVWKIYSLAQKNRFFVGVAGLVAVLSVLQFGASIGITTKFIMVNREAIRLHELKTPITIHLVTTAACDTVITLAMIVILSHYKDNTVFVKTKSLLNTLIVATIENGLITSVTAIGNLIIYFTRTQDMINIAFQYVIGGLYAIVLITTLNRRSYTGREGATSISLSDVNGFNTSRNNNISTGRGVAPSYQVNVITTVDQKTDLEAMGVTSSHSEYDGKQY